jgi:hypothetical protein
MPTVVEAPQNPSPSGWLLVSVKLIGTTLAGYLDFSSIYPTFENP